MGPLVNGPRFLASLTFTCEGVFPISARSHNLGPCVQHDLVALGKLPPAQPTTLAARWGLWHEPRCHMMIKLGSSTFFHRPPVCLLLLLIHYPHIWYVITI